MINVNTPWSLDKSMKNIAGGILKGAKNGCILYSITYIIALISENCSIKEIINLIPTWQKQK
jgi:hypothetical protein